MSNSNLLDLLDKRINLRSDGILTKLENEKVKLANDRAYMKQFESSVESRLDSQSKSKSAMDQKLNRMTKSFASLDRNAMHYNKHLKEHTDYKKLYLDMLDENSKSLREEFENEEQIDNLYKRKSFYQKQSLQVMNSRVRVFQILYMICLSGFIAVLVKKRLYYNQNTTLLLVLFLCFPFFLQYYLVGWFSYFLGFLENKLSRDVYGGA